MKLSRKLILTLALVLSVAVATTGTLAYLTDRESVANVFEIGNVDIELVEDFVYGSELVPGEPIEKKPKITNVGEKTAWVWGTIAIPTVLDRVHHEVLNPEGDNEFLYARKNHEGMWNWLTDDNNNFITHQADIHGVMYTVYTALWPEPLEKGQSTELLIDMVELHQYADVSEDGTLHLIYQGVDQPIDWNIKHDPYPVIHVSAYATQFEGFTTVDDAYAAYIEQWGEFADENNQPGAGTVYEWPATPVATEDELIEALGNLNANIKLTSDITLTEKWQPIGSKEEEIYFTGTLDGNNHHIYGLDVDGGDYVAFIAAAENATIKNLFLHGEVSGKNAAGLVARMESGFIDNCEIDVNVSGTTKAGGIVCLTNNGGCTIRSSVNKGDVNVGNDGTTGGVGGIVGYANPGTFIENCANEGDIGSDDDKYCGGIVGYFTSGGSLDEQFIGWCRNNGNINANTSAGGIVGFDTAELVIEGCESTTQDVLGGTNGAANVTIR